MKKYFYFITFIAFFFISCATTNVEKTSYDNVRLKRYMTHQLFYSTLVKRGFEVNSLDTVKNYKDFLNALKPYWYDEDGYPVDNHFTVVDLTGEAIESLGRTTCTSLRNGLIDTKEALQKDGFIENESMFYCPGRAINEKSYVTGHNFLKSTNGDEYWYYTSCLPLSSAVNYKMYQLDDILILSIFKHYEEDDFSEFAKKARAANTIIINIAGDKGGYVNSSLRLASILNSLKDKKIIFLTSNGTGSAGEILLLSCHNNHIKIGTRTQGTIKAEMHPTEGSIKFRMLGFQVYNYYDNSNVASSVKEGFGIVPDMWAFTIDDFVAAINLCLNEDKISSDNFIEMINSTYHPTGKKHCDIGWNRALSSR